MKKPIKTETKTMKPNINPVSTRTFQKEGKWIERPHRSLVVECECGYKYIPTRKNQTMCLKCTSLKESLIRQ